MICLSVQSVFHLLHLLSDTYHDIQCRPCMLPCNMQGQHWVSWYESDRAWFVSLFSQWIVSTYRGTPYRGTLPVTVTEIATSLFYVLLSSCVKTFAYRVESSADLNQGIF